MDNALFQGSVCMASFKASDHTLLVVFFSESPDSHLCKTLLASAVFPFGYANTPQPACVKRLPPTGRGRECAKHGTCSGIKLNKLSVRWQQHVKNAVKRRLLRKQFILCKWNSRPIKACSEGNVILIKSAQIQPKYWNVFSNAIKKKQKNNENWLKETYFTTTADGY